jgi:hypothetical protein
MSAIRIEQETDFVRSLQRRVVSGEVAPASFQRPYVWTEDDVEALWDSIDMGLPIGAFLLWRPTEPMECARTLGPVRLKPSRHSTLVLDGQNRLATLAWSAMDVGDRTIPEEAAGSGLWRGDRRLVADTHASRVRFADSAELSDPWLVPMHRVADGLQKHLRRIWDGDEGELPRVKWLEHLENRTIQARIVITTIHADETDARRAFARISRAGVPMSDADFESAITGAARAA